MDAEGQAAEYPEPENIQLPIPHAGGFENTVQQPGDGDGQNRLFEKVLDGLGSRHWQHLHSCLHYTDKIRPRPGAFEKSGKAHNRLYSSSLLRCLCGSASLGFSSRASTFWRRVSYSRSSRWAFLYSDCRAVRLAVSLSISARSRLVAGRGTASDGKWRRASW